MRKDADTSLPFHKMHGLGNDFVVVDARALKISLNGALAAAIGDRHRGVGFDQLALVEKSETSAARLTFFNSDGSISGACGNATRCIARMLMKETGQTALSVTTDQGDLAAHETPDGRVAVNMGKPYLDWREIPLSKDVDTLALPIEGNPSATGMGNPHCTFFVDDVDDVDLATFGSAHEHHPLFPERTNVQIAQVIGPNRIRMRVWERGAGITLASGSSSCATAVAAARRGLTGRTVTLELDGGLLDVDWREDGVWMTGPTAHVFSGALTPEFLNAL